ncbi:iron-enterobactin ABC transporter permease [Streptomyces reniochalinae]|uniref:Iron-enterobactin ABC transporter permease n=1 Tax=Streptomyces reniochalinae TaxID=2250578 RepID=A0A367EQY0_9ACTN|nr:iron-enterobactin ABC transporter permease [Streptomyces reniochalinae]
MSAEQGDLTVRGPRRLRVSARVPVRYAAVCALLVAATAGVTVAALMLGKVNYSPAQVLSTLTGDGTRVTELFILQWRLPRAVAAVVLGTMLGVAGALFQCITRNPLGSPDIIGFTAGASAGGVAVITFVGPGIALVAGGALAGGLVVTLLVVLFARDGGTAGFRLVIVGIGLNAMMVALETYFYLIADSDISQVAAVWGAGSLNAVSFSHTGPALATGAVLTILVCAGLQRALPVFDLGEDTAAALGVRPARLRLLLVLGGVVLVAVVTAAAGPIAFVALAAPHVGRRLAGTYGTALLPAACAGALILSSADLVAQHAVPGHAFPVGVVTVAVGGVYLLSLLVRENRKGTL